MGINWGNTGVQARAASSASVCLNCYLALRDIKSACGGKLHVVVSFTALKIQAPACTAGAKVNGNRIA
jgi:hypothetical protein